MPWSETSACVVVLLEFPNGCTAQTCFRRTGRCQIDIDVEECDHMKLFMMILQG